MRTATKNKNKFVLTLMFTIIILTLVVVVLVAALVKRPAEEIDPHEGQVYINDGFGMVWMTPLEAWTSTTFRRATSCAMTACRSTWAKVMRLCAAWTSASTSTTSTGRRSRRPA